MQKATTVPVDFLFGFLSEVLLGSQEKSKLGNNI